MTVREDHDRNWTHVDWEIDGVTARMIDWFWTNIDKGFTLWHPREHASCYWAIRPAPGQALGATYVGRHRWSDGLLMEPHVRFEDVESLPAEVADLIVYDHCVAGASLCFFAKDYKPTNPILAYRLHQWQATDDGVKGTSSALPVQPHPLETERSLIWARHTSEEVVNWAAFLPPLYRLFNDARGPDANVFFSFKVERDGTRVRYAARVSSDGATSPRQPVPVRA